MLEGAGRGGAEGHLTELNGWASPQLLLTGVAMPMRAVKQSDALEDVHAAIGPIARATLRMAVGHRRARPFLAREQAAATPAPPSARDGRLAPVTAANGTSDGS